MYLIMQKTTSFILPILGISDSKLHFYLKGTYLANTEYQGDNTIGEYLYVHVSNQIEDYLLSRLRTHKLYKAEYDPTDETIMFVFNLGEQFKRTVVAPFLKGEYSKIDRAYVNAHFVPMYNDGSESRN